MNGLIGFMNGGLGRLARAILGVALIGWGLASFGGTTGYVVAAIGLLPLALAVWGRCLLELLAPSQVSRHA